MKMGKTAAFIAAALMALGSVSVSADAEEMTEYSLLSAPISEIPEVKSLEDMGGGYYLCSDGEGIPFKIIYIGDGEISKWRETGKLSWKDVECDIDLENYYGCSSAPSEEGNFFGIALKRDRLYYYYYCESSDDHTKITAKPFGVYWADVHPDGYVFASQGGNSYFGKGMELKEIDFGYHSGTGQLPLRSGEYIGGVFYRYDPEATIKYESPYDERFYYATLRLADKNGNVTEIYSTPEPSEDNYCSYISSDTIFMCNNAFKDFHWQENYMKDGVETRLHKIYCFDSGELLTFPYNDRLRDGRTVELVHDMEDGVFDGKAIMEVHLQDSNYLYYALVDTETGEFVSDVYLSLSTRDGEYFLANDENSGWTLIDRDGNRLCDFEDVSEFYGGIAMACDKGEGFLIDGNMEKISDTVPAESAFMGNDENIFISSRDGEYYFVTYVKNGADTEIPETGNVGVLTLIICMAASGLVAVKTRKAYNERKG